MKKTTLILAMTLLLLFKGADAIERGDKLVRITLTSKDVKIEAILNESAPAKELLSRLPITLNLHQHQAREYYANIRLDKNDRTQDGYQVGDIAYWTPGNSLVFFYDKGYTGSLIQMGKITAGLDKLSKMGSSFEVKIEKIEN